MAINFHPLNNELAIAAQITVADVASLSAQGFKSIINNRPDNEEPGQATHAQIAEAAATMGMHIVHQPVLMSTIAAPDGAAFAKILADLPKPVLAYCRSGRRCSVLFQLAQQA